MTPLVPQARRPALEAARVYMAHTRPRFVGLLSFGSAFTGGYIPGCSDTDFHLFLSEAAFGSDGDLPLHPALAIHMDLAKIDPVPFQYFQCHARPARLVPGDTISSMGPIPATYHVLAGKLPVPEATPEEVQSRARRSLAELGPYLSDLSGSLLGHGGDRLKQNVRLLCTKVWPTLYSVLALRMADPLVAWTLPKEDVIAMVPEGERVGGDIRRFYHSVLEYYPVQDSVEGALRIIEHGFVFLRTAGEWYNGLDNDAG